MSLPVFTFAALIGLLLLIWSADRFVRSAAGLALRLGISPLVIGLTVVALGTSAPEILVSGSAAWQGSTDMALGNAQGSNVANIGLVLGLVLLLAPLPVSPGLAGRQSVALLLAMAALGFVLHDLSLSRPDALLLLFGLLVFLAATVRQGQRDRRLAAVTEAAVKSESSVAGSLVRQYLTLTASLLLLLAGARLLTWGASMGARELGLSELVIGATILAVGTSLPELATAISSTRRGHHDMTLGNLLGSNAFNIFAVIGTAGIIGPEILNAAVWQRDFLFLAVSGLMLLGLIALYTRRQAMIPRYWAWPLLGLYALYLVMNYRALMA